MLANFKQRVRDAKSDPGHVASNSVSVIQDAHGSLQDTDESVPLGPGSQDHGPLLLPSSRSVVQVLYSPLYTGQQTHSPDPPPYATPPGDTETSPTGPETVVTQPNPLAEDPALTGVPSEGTADHGAAQVDPNPPLIDFANDSEEPEPLPPYSRFDERRPRFPFAADVLGPYPPLPVLRTAAR